MATTSRDAVGGAGGAGDESPLPLTRRAAFARAAEARESRDPTMRTLREHLTMLIDETQSTLASGVDDAYKKAATEKWLEVLREVLSNN